MSKRYFRCRFM